MPPSCGSDGVPRHAPLVRVFWRLEGPMWTTQILKPLWRHQRLLLGLRGCGPGRKRSAEKGIRRSPGSLWRGVWQLPWAATYKRRRPASAVRQANSERSGGHQRQVAWVVRKAVRRSMITLPGLAVCWSSSYTRSETSRVHSPPRVMATGPDRHGAWRFGADVTSDGE
jgi:hypothetical protein